MDLVLNTIQARQHLRGASEIRIGGGVGGAEFNTDRLGIRRVGRNPDRRATIPRTVGKVNRRLVPGNQPFEAVRCRVRDGSQCPGMLDDSADVVESEFAQVGIALSGKERLAVFPDTLVAVHPRAVISEERFRHESGGLAVAPSDIANHILVEVHLVARANQGVETDVDFGLASGGDFMMLPLNLHPEILQHESNLIADILLCVGRRNREVSLLVTDFVPSVRHFFAATVEDALGRIHLIERAPRGGVIANIIKNKEFRFRSKESGVANLRAL